MDVKIAYWDYRQCAWVPCPSIAQHAVSTLPAQRATEPQPEATPAG